MQKLKNALRNINSVLRREWELFKFRRRQAARARKRYPIYWGAHLKLIWDDLKLMHEIEPEKFDEKFLEKNLQAYEAIKKTNLKIGLGLIGIIIFLILSTLKIDLPISIIGIKLTPAPGLNELLIIVVSVVTASTVGKSISLLTLVTSIRCSIQLIYKDGFTYFHLLNSNIEDVPIYYRPSLSPQIVTTKITRLASGFITLFLYLKILMLLAISIVWRYYVYFEIWTNPSLSAQLGKTAVSISLLIDVAALVFLLIYIIPLPHRDYSVLHTLEIAKQQGPEAEEQAYQDVYGDDWDDKDEMIKKGYISKT